MSDIHNQLIVEQLKRIADALEGLYDLQNEKKYPTDPAPYRPEDVENMPYLKTEPISKPAPQKKPKKEATKKVGSEYELHVPDWEEPPTGKSYLVRNEEGLIAFIGKSLVRDITGESGDWTFHFTTPALKWFDDSKIEWKEDKY